MSAGDCRGIGKNNEFDVSRIGRAVLGLPLSGLRIPRKLSSERAQVALRVLVMAREQMTAERTRTINTLIALMRTVDFGVDARKPLTARQITTVRRLARPRHGHQDRHLPPRRDPPGSRVRTLDEDLARSRTDLTELITQDTLQLLERRGVGTVVAANVVIAWSHPG